MNWPVNRPSPTPLEYLTDVLGGDYWSSRMISIAFSPDGKLIAAVWSATDYGTGCDQDVMQRLQVWRVKDALQRAYLEPEAMLYAVEVNSFAFSPDSRVLVHQNVGGGIAVCDTAAHRVTQVWGSNSAFNGGTFSPDGKLLAVAESMDEDGHPDDHIALYDTQSGKKLKTFSDEIWTSMAFAKDNRTLAGLSGYSLRLIDILTGDVRNIRLGQSWTLSQNGGVAVQPMPSEIRVFDFETGKSQAIPEEQGIQKLLLSDDGALLAVVDGQGEVRIWDTASGKVKATLASRLSASDIFAFSIRFNGDGTILATPFSEGNSDGQLILWNTATGEQIGVITGLGYALLFSPHGSVAAVDGGYTPDTMAL